MHYNYKRDLLASCSGDNGRGAGKSTADAAGKGQVCEHA